MAELELITRQNRLGYREYGTPDGDLVIARKKDDVWHVTAHSADLGAEVKGSVIFNEGGFRGRQWESFIDGQQYPSLVSAMRAAVERARSRAEAVRFARHIESEFAKDNIFQQDQQLDPGNGFGVHGRCQHCGDYAPVKPVWNRPVPMEYKQLCRRCEALTRW